MRVDWPRPDFVAPRPRPPALAWVLAAVAMLVLGLLLSEVVELRRGSETHERRAAELGGRTLGTAGPPARRASEPASGAQSPTAARHVADLIDHPWGPLLTVIESETPAGIQWLAIDHDADSPQVRLEGTSLDAATALQVVDALSARAGWSDVILSRLQLAGTRGSAAMWQFEIRAAIDARRVAAPREPSDNN